MLAIIEEQAANVATVRDTGDARFLRMFLPTPFSASGGSGIVIALSASRVAPLSTVSRLSAWP
jgi:hypothetical protein